MPKFNITVEETYARVVEIEADSVEDAIDIACATVWDLKDMSYVEDSFQARHFED